MATLVVPPLIGSLRMTISDERIFKGRMTADISFSRGSEVLTFRHSPKNQRKLGAGYTSQG